MHDYYDYKTVRDTFRTGDLLVWGTDDSSLLSFFFTRLVRYITMSDYSHTAVVWCQDDRIYAIDATIPKIKLTPLSECKDFYHIPMGIDLSLSELSTLSDYIYKTYIGKSYSILDGIRGLLGYTDESNDRWQCAELCHNFYKQINIDLGEAYTPSKLVKSVFTLRNTVIRFIAHE